MNEDLYDNGSAVVGLFRLFTNFLKFPGESPGLGGSIGGRGVSLGSQDLPSPILHFSHLSNLRLFPCEKVYHYMSGEKRKHAQFHSILQ